MRNNIYKVGAGTKALWFLLFLYIGSGLDSLRYEQFDEFGWRIFSALLLIIGMTLYSRTKRRKFELEVKGSKIVDSILLIFLTIHLVAYMLEIDYMISTQPIALWVVVGSMIAFLRIRFSKPKLSRELNDKKEN